MGLTIFEKTRIIGARVLQLSCGAPALIKLTGTPMEIAEAELKKGVLPIVAVRE
ncbi:MAG: DNA-directed RNA polymerase subunit K [Candidatus Aenigmarchaeota archaeon]|nr:DNA-directed RNA polymerase subunit K [Candidatus Aenigmarchaeota archaeon]